MKAREIDEYILACPYFKGKDCVDRKIFDDGLTHVGACSLMWNHDKVCPSEKCLCADVFGLRERKDDDKSCDTCKHYDKGWDDIICDGCTKAHSNWERKDDE